jgi:hypothetical protein
MPDDETTAASTLVLGTDQSTQEDNIDAMLEEQSDAIEEIQVQQQQEKDVIMTDNNRSTTNQRQQQQQQITTKSKVTTAIAAGDFNHQFNMNKSRNDKIGSNAPILGVNRQQRPVTEKH